MIREKLPLATGLALAMSLSACSEEASRVEQATVSTPVPIESPISIEQQQLEAYEALYGDCPTPITFLHDQTPPSERPGEQTIAFVERTGVVALTAFFESQTEKAKRDTLAHEITHACTKEPTVLRSPIPYHEGIITGMHGFHLDITLKSGEKTGFSLIDEAAAEALASVARKGYSVPFEGYFRIGNLMLDIMGQTALTPHDLADLHRNNDVMGLIARYRNVPIESIGAGEIAQFMTLFNDTYNNKTPN